jgi:hypothetical protein
MTAMASLGDMIVFCHDFFEVALVRPHLDPHGSRHLHRPIDIPKKLDRRIAAPVRALEARAEFPQS